MISVASIGPRYLRAHRGRSALAAASVAFAVALFVGTLGGTTTLNREMHRLGRALTGSADVEVRPLGVAADGLSPDTLHRLASLPDVGAVAPVVGAAAILGGTQELVVGADPGPASDVLGLTVSRGRLAVAGRDEVVLTPELADRAHLAPGMAVTLGTQRVTVVGILVPTSLGLANRGDAVVAPAALARSLSARSTPADVALVRLVPGVAPSAWIDRHRAALPGTELENVAQLRHPLASLFDGLDRLLVGFSLLALFLSGYLIHLTFSGSVAERTSTYGTLLALGTSRRQLAGTVVAEALVLAAVGSAVGLVLGAGIAVALAFGLTGIFHLPVPAVTVPPLVFVGGALVGVVAAVIGALLPARRASKVTAVEAMRGEADVSTQRRWVPVAGALLVLVAALVSPARGSMGLSIFFGFITLVAAVQLLPPAIPWIARRLRPVARIVAPGPGEIGVLHLVRQRTRSGYTAGLVTSVFAVSLMVGAGYVSLHPAFADYIRRQFGADLSLRATSKGLASSTLPAGYEEHVAATAGVAAVAPVWWGSATLPEPGHPTAAVEVVDANSYFHVSSFHWTAGDEAVAASALRSPGNVLLSLDLSRRLNAPQGRDVTLETTSGPHRFRVAAVFASFGNTSGGVVAGADDGRRLFGTGRPNQLLVRVRPGVSPRAVSATLVRNPGSAASLGVAFGADGVRQALRQFNGVFVVYLMILGVATLVGVLGLASTVAISVLDRRREIGVLRAVGIQRADVRRMVVVETAALVVVAFAFGIVCGTLAASRTFSAGFSNFGFPAAFRFPWLWLPVMAASAVVATMLAAALPARRASALNVVDALRVD